MAIYEQLLTMALREEMIGSDVAALMQVALDHRPSIQRATMSPTRSLRIAFDAALIRLCGACGIEADASRFDPPLIERTRVERRLALIGVDLHVIATGVSVGGEIDDT
jgi:hypothetical protein